MPTIELMAEVMLLREWKAKEEFFQTAQRKAIFQALFASALTEVV